MANEVAFQQNGVSQVQIVCLNWNFMRNETCRHFDQIDNVSIVDCNGNSVLELKSNYNTKSFKSRIQMVIRGKVLVGYNLGRFLRLVNLDHPLELSKDLIYFGPFVKRFWNRKSRPSLDDLVLDLLRVDMKKNKIFPGKVEAARKILDLWHLMQRHEDSPESDKVHIARFLLPADADGTRELFDCSGPGRLMNKIRKAGGQPTGFHVSRLTKDYYERVVEITFSSVDDLCQVINEMLTKCYSGNTLRILLHTKMVQYVESRFKVFQTLYKTTATMFPLQTPRSSERVLLLQGTTPGILKTLVMMTKMAIQLEKDPATHFYSFHSDFYDPANADSKIAQEYGGFGKMNIIPAPKIIVLQPHNIDVIPISVIPARTINVIPAPGKISVIPARKTNVIPVFSPKVLPSRRIMKCPPTLTPSVSYVCVKAKLSIEVVNAPTALLVNTSTPLPVTSLTGNKCLPGPISKPTAVVEWSKSNDSTCLDSRSSALLRSGPLGVKTTSNNCEHQDQGVQRGGLSYGIFGRKGGQEYQQRNMARPGQYTDLHVKRRGQDYDPYIKNDGQDDGHLCVTRDGRDYEQCAERAGGQNNGGWQPGVVSAKKASSKEQTPVKSSETYVGGQTSVNMTVSRGVVGLLEEHMDTLTMPGASISVGDVDRDNEVVMSISGTESQIREAYSRVQVVIERNSPSLQPG
eukprot:GFUD01043722.1.p1 GENE.GFUD01043722.1~~GFUD01043722.1.p1  ORF type:complete len:706 (+),score=114.13 GFUD01043722.1:55-2118(+)